VSKARLEDWSISLLLKTSQHQFRWWFNSRRSYQVFFGSIHLDQGRCLRRNKRHRVDWGKSVYNPLVGFSVLFHWESLHVECDCRLEVVAFLSFVGGWVIISRQSQDPRLQDFRGARIVVCSRCFGVKGTEPTRLETRTKVSDVSASVDGKKPEKNLKKLRRVMKVIGGKENTSRCCSLAPPADLNQSSQEGVQESSWSTAVRTRKTVNLACRGRSQRKLWWRLVATLTCKSFVSCG